MSSIHKVLKNRLEAEAQEADQIGLVKIASNIKESLNEEAVRDSDNYVYAYEDLEKDIQKSLWKMAIRASDYHNKHVRAEDVQSLIEYYSEDFLKSFRKLAKVNDVGEYEPEIPGFEKK